MKFKSILFVAALTGATALIASCADEKDPRLSDADAAFLKQQRLQAQYGSATVSSTSTVVNYVTVTSTTTVTK